MRTNTYQKTIDLARLAVGFALVQFGGGVSQIRGSIAGTTFSRNRAGAIARSRTKPINPGTISQSLVRASFGASSAAWGGLDTTQTEAWDAYGTLLTRLNRIGESYTPKGRQLFIECNHNLTLVGLPQISVPSPVTDSPSMLELGTLVLESDVGEIATFTIANVTVTVPSGAEGKVIIDASPAHDPKLTNVNNLFRTILVIDADDTAVNLATPWIAVFGSALVPGQVIDIRARVVDNNTGLGSASILGQIVAVAA